MNTGAAQVILFLCLPLCLQASLAVPSLEPGAEGQLRVADAVAFGANADGSYGGGDAIQLAIDAVASGGIVILPPGSYNVTRPLIVAGKSIGLRGTGGAAYIWSREPIALLRKTGHGVTLRLEGMTFDAQHRDGVGVLCENVSTTFTASLDTWITDCSFTGEGRGIELRRTREALISGCRFTVGREGILLEDASNPLVTSCVFSPLQEDPATRGIRYNGRHASVFSAGLRVLGCTMMGLGVGVEVTGTDFVAVASCLIDYCDSPVRLTDQDGAVIQGNYLGARGMKGDRSSVGIEVRGEQMTSQHVKILGNIITAYDSTASSRTGILADNVHGLTIADNTIHFWNDRGIRHLRCQRVVIERNTILPAHEGTGIAVSTPVSGEAILPAGTSSIVVEHGLGVFPSRVFLTPDAPVACGATARTATTFTITLAGAPTHPVRVSWKVEE